MDLKTLCMQNMVEMIKNMPPLLKEEIISVSLQAIKEEAKKELMKELRRSASIVVQETTKSIINSQKTGQNWERPDYTKDIDDELYYTFTEISEQFVNAYADKLVFNSTSNYPRYMFTDSDSDDEN